MTSQHSETVLDDYNRIPGLERPISVSEYKTLMKFFNGPDIKEQYVIPGFDRPFSVKEFTYVKEFFTHKGDQEEKIKYERDKDIESYNIPENYSIKDQREYDWLCLLFKSPHLLIRKRLWIELSELHDNTHNILESPITDLKDSRIDDEKYWIELNGESHVFIGSKVVKNDKADNLYKTYIRYEVFPEILPDGKEIPESVNSFNELISILVKTNPMWLFIWSIQLPSECRLCNMDIDYNIIKEDIPVIMDYLSTKMREFWLEKYAS